jgi:putative FmdB family regulatory protein
MPTYDYECEACGHKFEKFQSMSAPHLRKCPKCGKNKLVRLIGTGSGMIFKGSGFYITDYRDKSYSDKAKAESGGGSTDSKEAKDSKESKESKESSSGDSKKPETKTEAAPAAAPKVEKSEPKASKSSAKKRR